MTALAVPSSATSARASSATLPRHSADAAVSGSRGSTRPECARPWAALGVRGLDFDVGPRGPVYKKWMESCFVPRVQSRGQSSRLDEKRAELTLLVKALDEFSRGRMLEVGDILGTRLRSLAYQIENPSHEGLARQMLAYPEEDPALVPPAVVDAALKLEAAAKRRNEKLTKVARRSRTAER